MQTSDEFTPIEIDIAAVKNRLDSGDEFAFVDCREEDEYQIAKIEGTVLVPLSQLQAKAQVLEEMRDRDIIIHCHHGGRSLQLAQMLRANGFEKAQSMAGGIDQWSQEIDPEIPRY